MERQHFEGPLLKKEPGQVMSEFEGYQKGAAQGFATHQDELNAYGRLIGSIGVFFTQDGIEKSPEVAKELIGKLFYDHATTASIQVEFFREVNQALEDNDKNRPSDMNQKARVKEDVEIVKNLVQLEFGKVLNSATNESNGVQYLVGLAEKDSGETTQALRADLSAVDAKKDDIQEHAFASLSQEVEFRADIDRVGAFVEKVAEFCAEYNVEKLPTLHSQFPEFFKQSDGSDLLDDLQTRIFTGQHDAVKSMLLNKAQAAESPLHIWSLWVEKGLIPPLLLESFDEILTLSSLQQTAQIVSGLPKEARARHLLPFLQKGISSVMLTEIVEGRDEIPTGIIKQQVDAFIHFYDEYDKAEEGRRQKALQDPGWSLKRKIVIAALVGSLAASPFVYNHFQPQKSGLDIDALVDELPEDELSDLQGIKFADNEIDENQQPPQQKPVEGGTTPSQQDRQIDRGFDSQRRKPKNDSPEGLIEAQKTVYWNLAGKNLTGFYRTGTASKFDLFFKEWHTGKNLLPQDRLVSSKKRDITVSTTMQTPGGRIIELPSKATHRLSENMPEVRSNVFPFVVRSDDGTYTLVFPTGADNRMTDVIFSLGEEESLAIPVPTRQELTEMRQEMVNINDLPSDTKAFMQSMAKRPDLSAGTKAKLLEKFIRNTFLYSLNPKWSDYYHGGQDSNEFIKRIFGVKKADCDVANTALVALLRSQGIPSRFVYGFANTGGFLDGDSTKLTGSERHGWVESYINGRWISLDATPKEMDEFTKKSLEGQLTPSQQQRLQENEEFAIGLESLKEFAWEDDIMRSLLLVELINIGMFGASRLLRRRNNKEAERLTKEVHTRAKKYVGDDRLQNYFASRDRDRDVRNKEYGPSVAAGIFPPFGAIAFLNDVLRTVRLKKLPYNNRSQASGIEQSKDPNVMQFLTESLGYKKEDIQNRMRIESYTQSRIQVYKARYEALEKFLVGDRVFAKIWEFQGYTFGIGSLQDQISKIRLVGFDNSNLLNLAKTQAAIEKAYEFYMKRRKSDSKWLVKNAAFSENEMGQPYTKEEFIEFLKEMQKYQMLLLHMRNQFEEIVPPGVKTKVSRSIYN